MNHRRLEHVKAAEEEAIRLGATFTLETGGRHLTGIIAINGKTRKTPLSVSASDHRAAHKARKFVRRVISEMTAKG